MPPPKYIVNTIRIIVTFLSMKSVCDRIYAPMIVITIEMLVPTRT